MLKMAIVWLMGWPAGLKLNSNLDHFLGKLFLQLIYIWTGFIFPMRSIFVVSIRFIAQSGLLGATMITAMFADMLTLSTIHLYVFYRIATRLYHWQLNVLSSLFNLFRGMFESLFLNNRLTNLSFVGKKYNVLRDRLDSCDYDLDQLLLGTILFTLLFFLFPTVLVYYVLFVIVS